MWKATTSWEPGWVWPGLRHVSGNTGPPLYQQTGVATSYRMKRAMLRWWSVHTTTHHYDSSL